MMPLTRVGMVVVVAALSAGAWGAAQAPDPFVGTWTLNVAKSKYDPGPAPKEQTATYEAAGFALTGMFPVILDRPTARVVEFDAVMVRVEPPTS